MKRLGYLDGIRGAMILWMLVVHISLNYGILSFGEPRGEISIFTLLSFFMCPFYFFSGYLFSFQRSFWDYIKNKIRKLLVPYCFFLLYGIVIYELYCYLLFRNFDISVFANFYIYANSFTNTPLWFLFSLFCVSVLYYVLSKNSSQIVIRVFVLLCFVIALFTKNQPQFLCYGNILLGLVYFHLGQELKRYEYYLLKRRKTVAFGSGLVFLVIGLVFPTSLEFVANILTDGNYILNLVFSICGCILLWLTFINFPQSYINRCLQIVGRSSLVIFASHRPILNYVCEPLIRWIWPNVSYSFFLFANIVILLTFGFLFEKTLLKISPLLIGK